MHIVPVEGIGSTRPATKVFGKTITGNDLKLTRGSGGTGDRITGKLAQGRVCTCVFV